MGGPSTQPIPQAEEVTVEATVETSNEATSEVAEDKEVEGEPLMAKAEENSLDEATEKDTLSDIDAE